MPHLPDIEALMSRGTSEFDADPQARDYEESAVLIRYLLSDSERGRAFQAFLRGVASGDPADLDALLRHLGWPPASGPDLLDRRLRRWLQDWTNAGHNPAAGT